MFKKILCMTLACVLMLSLCACKKKQVVVEDISPATQPTSTTYVADDNGIIDYRDPTTQQGESTTTESGTGMTGDITTTTTTTTTSTQTIINQTTIATSSVQKGKDLEQTFIFADKSSITITIKGEYANQLDLSSSPRERAVFISEKTSGHTILELRIVKELSDDFKDYKQKEFKLGYLLYKIGEKPYDKAVNAKQIVALLSEAEKWAKEASIYIVDTSPPTTASTTMAPIQGGLG